MNDQCTVGGVEMFTRQGAAKRLGMSPHTILREVERGRLGFTRHPRGLLFTQEDLDEWLARMRTRPRKAKGARA